MSAACRSSAAFLAIAILAGAGADGPMAQDVSASDTGQTDEPRTPTTRTTERVEVETDRIPVDTTVSSTELSGEELRQRGWDLADLLRRVPGARVRDYGGLGAYATVSLRASTSEQVRVLIDGVPSNGAWGGGVDLGAIAATRIESVRVFRGFAPAGLGLAGIGGAVDIRTRAPDATGNGSAEMLVGELGTLRVAASSSLPVGDGALNFGIEGLDGDGDFHFLDDGGTPFDASDDRIRHRENQRLEQRSVWLRGESDPWFSSLRASFLRRGVEPPIRRPNPTATTTERRIDGSIGRRFSASELRADLRARRDRFDDSAGDFLFPQRRSTDSHAVDLSWSLDRPRAAVPWTLRVEGGAERIDLRDDLIERSDRGGAVRLRAAASAESVRVEGKWTIAPSFRIDAVRDDFRAGGAGTVPAPADDVERVDLSGKLGARRPVGTRQAWIGSVGRTFRRPNLLELFGDRGAVRGSPDLSAESAWGAEVGWQIGGDSGRNSGAELSVVGFARRTRDMIRFVPASQGVSVARNLAEVRTHGVEVEARWSPIEAAGAEISVTHQVSRQREGAAAAFLPLVYQPELLGALRLHAERKRLRLTWDATYTGENPTDTLDTPSLRLGERWIHDAAAFVDLGQGLSLSIDVRNLFDRRTLDVLRYPLPGRVALVGLRWSGG